MVSDGQLLREYSENRSEEAFTELVNRRVDLVYSTALRCAGGDASLAEDAVQRVFADLARRAGTLPVETAVAGWLYRHTFFTASKMMRAERRRRRREQEASTMNAILESPDNEHFWQQVAPALDEAINRLSAKDRHVIVLRFFQEKDLRTLGAALGVSDDAAQKRVTRALGKLRHLLIRRGKTLSTATLATLLADHAVTAAPVGLAASVAGVAMAAAASSAGLTLTFIRLMSMTNLKLGVAASLVLAAVTTPLVLQQHATEELRKENLALRQQTRAEAQQADMIGKLRAQNRRLSRLKLDTDELARLRAEHDELLRLRGQVGVLERELTNRSASTTSETQPTSDRPLILPADQLQDVGAESPQAAIETFLWAAGNNQAKRMSELLDFQSFKDILFVKVREAQPNISIEDAAKAVSAMIAKAKEGMALAPGTEGEFNGIASISIGQPVESQTVSNAVLVKVARTYPDGRSDSETLQLRQLNGSYLISPEFSQTTVTVTPGPQSGSYQAASGQP